MTNPEPAMAPGTSAAPTQDSVAVRSRFAMRRRLESLPLVVALILVVVIFQSLNALFLNPRNLVNLLVELAPIEFIAMASTVMIVMGEIDLSLGSIAGFTSAALAALLANAGIPWPVALLLVFAAGVGISGVQGVIVVGGRVRSFAVTLAGYLIWYGAQLAVLGMSGYIPLRREPINLLALARLPEWLSIGAVVVLGVGALYAWLFAGQGDRSRNGGLVAVRAVGGLAVVAALVGLVLYLQTGGGIPLVFALVLIIAAGLWVLFTRTALGRHMYAVGGDLHAARESGVNINKVKWIGFALSGALATCAGVAILAYTGGADTSAGTGSLLLAGIGATVVGGVSLTGGRGSVWGAFGGAILLEAVGNGLNLMSLSFYAVFIVEGFVVLAALLTDAAVRRQLGSSR
jgi:D-xylose transport system permease protein